MDFTKIKENIFVIIIGVLFVGALAAAIVSYTKKNEATNAISTLQANLLDEIQKLVIAKLTENKTIYPAFEKTKEKVKKIGNYTLDLSSGVLYLATANSGKNYIELEDDTISLAKLIKLSATAQKGKLFFVLAPEKAIDEDTRTIICKKSSDGRDIEITPDDWMILETGFDVGYINGNGPDGDIDGKVDCPYLSKYQPNVKGFISDGYFGLGGFDTEEKAIDFANEYFPNSYIIRLNSSDNKTDDVFAIMVPIHN